MQRVSFNLAAHVLAAGQSCPDKAALQVVGAQSETLSYAALTAAVLGTATGLIQAGLRPGDRVLMRLGNTPDFPIAYLGALAAGLVPVPTSAALTKSEVTAIIAELAPKAILHDPHVPCPADRRRIDLNVLRGFRKLPPAPYHMGDPERPGYIIYTSGTSGAPRAVVHAHRAILARQMMFQGWYGLGPGDRMMHAGAFNWTYTLGTGLMDPWTLGAVALIPAPGTDAAALPALMAQHKASIFAAAPGVYRQALRGDVPTLPNLRHGLSAGEKMPGATQQAWQNATGTPVFEAYGMSECSTFISSAPGMPAAPGTIGCAQPGRKIAMMGPGGPVAPGTPGVIAVHRSDPGLMLGYLDQPEETAARFKGNWFLTGDIGTAAPDGQITYLGRNDDMLNAGGFRVSPLEIENVLNAHQHITGAACIELPVASGAKVIAAFYTSTMPLEETALASYVEDKLARYKQPRIYQRVDTLPTGANGKLLRRRLRDDWKGHEWKR